MTWRRNDPGLYIEKAEQYVLSGHFVTVDDDEANRQRFPAMRYDEVRADVRAEFCKLVPEGRAEIEIGILKEGPRYTGMIKTDSRLWSFSLDGRGFAVWAMKPSADNLAVLYRLLDVEAKLGQEEEKPS